MAAQGSRGEAATAVSGGRRPASHRTRLLLLYVYGGFARRLGGWFAVSDLIKLMSLFEIEPAAVRTAVSRLTRDGLLTRTARAGSAGYTLAAAGWRLLEEGDQRILAARAPADLSAGWVVVVFSIPESRRNLRHQVRGQLTWHGFGTLAPGVWLAPLRLRSEIESALAGCGAGSYVDILEARYDGLEAARRMVTKAWDIPALAGAYGELVRLLDPVARRRGGRSPEPEQAFVEYVTAIAAWRKLPYLDPGLPAEVLPADWPGDTARWLYFSLLAQTDEPALRYVRAMQSKE